MAKKPGRKKTPADLKDAKSVADEILYNHDEEAGAVGIYELVLVETVDPPKDEDDDD